MQQDGYHSTLALHVSQDAIPVGAVGQSKDSLPLSAATSTVAQHARSGYGPLPPSAPTPLQHLAQQHLHEDSEFELLCAPLSNGNWHQRWERMCVAQPLASTSSKVLNGVDGSRSLQMLDAYEDPEEAAERFREAESWRLAGCFKRGEVNATRSDETTALIALASEWLELDSDVEGIRFDSELALKQEVAYAVHLHVTTLILPMPRNPGFVTDYARAVANILSTPGYLQLSIRIPISHASSEGYGTGGANASWEMWNSIRSLCSYNPRLSVTLDLSTPLPSTPVLARWQSEPVRHIFLPASAYLANAKGYPVLSKSCQAFFKSMFQFRPTIILSGVHKNLHTSGGPEAYASYIRFLERKTPIDDPLQQFAGAYMDYLQAPLQPLMDNLENDTYEGFERDPVKYRQYEEAVYQALVDRAPANGPPFRIFVCGAGRGPLVEGCLRAAKRAERQIHLTAVEKNPNAFVILQERKAVEWGDAVDLVFSDMRTFNPSHPADIIVSELLGSFGDNELSPECLDGVMRTLAPNGISIPSSYTSYLAPIASSKLHAEVSNTTDSKYPEQPYVVMFQASHVMSEQGGRENWDKFAECWGFDHPRNDIICDASGLPLTNHHNARSAHVTFHIPNGGACHGFGGYFEAVLYNDIGISIHPERMDKNMLSWFPLFFPLKEPLYLPPRSELDVHIFRLVDGARRRVWFEWSADAYLPLPTHSIAPSPTYSSSNHANAALANGHPPHGRLRASSPMDSRSVSATSNSNVPLGSPYVDTFGSAIGSPFLPAETLSSAGLAIDPSHSRSMDGVVRLKIGQTKLHNPNGRSSWVGL